MIKPLAIYLPQFHTIPENDLAWGEGFTEWTNVKKAEPLFEGHYQPHVPHENVGYYNLCDPNVMVRQASMAKEHGIYGFAFYHYWFSGKRLLETPLDNMLKTGNPDFPFVYIWANESWTKRWNGNEQEIIQEQKYSHEDDLAHIRYLCNHVFSDTRYITIDNKPMFLVYRTEILPDSKETARIWREEARKNGFKDLFLVRVENFKDDINPIEIGFDASMEFAPGFHTLDFTEANIKPLNNNLTYDYISTVEKMSLKADRNYPWFRCVYPGWDNSARKTDGAILFINNTPEIFRQSVYRTIEYTKRTLNEESQYFFINAWNEWSEGCHIEPDIKNGYRYLESLHDVLYNKSNSDLLEYLAFLERWLKIRVDEHNELETLKLSYEKIINSRSHKIMKLIVLWYRKVKNLLR